MPSTLHESLIEMFRARPALATDLLVGPLNVAVPAYERATVASADLTTLAPAEFRADAVLTFTTAADDETPALAVIVEVQLHEDENKKRSWPTYVANLHARLDCPVVLLVVCPRARTATWARSAIELGPGHIIQPMVVGPEAVPVVTDPARARQEPELAIISALTHGRDLRHRAILDAATTALNTFDPEHALLYAETMLVALPKEARRYLEAHMAVYDIHEPKTEFFRRMRDKVLAEGLAEGRAAGLAQGRAEGLAEGRAEGLAEGRAEGRAEGEALGEAKSILTVLAARGVGVPDDARARILNCSDLRQLEAWLEHAVTADSTDDLFGRGSQ
ncbi:hypothetical protein [Phytoactinopolyspora halotolerans]|uniref:Rpn family recombination-promoting nuclease/putative transposase n=1 Tax=Phytoactinopolyspora halotolerans TaxID=1981512 RepID=A0A6L9SFY9_9ACTN|nr:hypothetical protein [Phytoactinopolyspora halotolerans]NEE03558.1 hypothetical protein [Phytoactinopolyspora halotolerans]